MSMRSVKAYDMAYSVCVVWALVFAVAGAVVGAMTTSGVIPRRLSGISFTLGALSAICAALSCGRGNNPAEDLAWFHPVESLSRPRVQFPSDCGEVSPSDGVEVEVLREVLA